MTARIILPSLSIGALCALRLLTTAPAHPIEAGRDTATLVPDRAVAYVEAPGLSELLDGGLDHPLLRSVLASGVGELIEKDSGHSAEDLLAFADGVVGVPILPTLAGLTTHGAALGVAFKPGKPVVLLVLRGDDADEWEDTLDMALELAAAKAGASGAFAEPSTTVRGTPVWYVGDDLVLGLRDATFFASNDEGLLRDALDLAASPDARGLGSRSSFAVARGRSAENLVWGWVDLARIEQLAARAGKGEGLEKLRELTHTPATQLLLGPGICALGSASVISARLSLEREDLRLALFAGGVDTGTAARLLPSEADGSARPRGWSTFDDPANALELVAYRDLATVFRDRVELFPPETLPGFAEATNILALLFGGVDVSESVLPGLSPWVRVVARPVTFEDGAEPELPLPAAAALIEVRDPKLGPRLVSAFQTAVGLINVDRAQKAADSLVMRMELVGEVQMTSAHFPPPGEGDGVDMRYNLVPACALVGDVFVVGTHASLVRELARGAPTAAAQAHGAGRERLSLAGPAAASVLRNNYEALVMKAVLEEGKTRAKAQADLDGLIGALGLVERLELEVGYGASGQVSLLLDVDLRGGPR